MAESLLDIQIENQLENMHIEEEESNSEGEAVAPLHSSSSSRKLTYSPENSMMSTSSSARAESAQIMSKKYHERNNVKSRMLEEEKLKRLQKEKKKKQQVKKWQSKTKRSPFMVDLVAENQRIDEENRMRIREENRRMKTLEKRKDKVKNEIILRALEESSDLEALRREKRAIMEEEKRLKALMDLEKTNSHRKTDLIAAKRAEKHRKQAKAEYRRKQVLQHIEEREDKYKQLLKEKLDIADE